MQNKILTILGRKGCGKTTLANKILNSFYSKGYRVWVCSPMGGLTVPGVPVLDGSFNSFEELSGRSCIVEPVLDIQAERLFSVCNEVQKITKQKAVLVVDEIDLYLDWKSPNEDLRHIIRYGRHANLSLVAISQRAANVHNDLLAQSDKRIIFNTTEPNDLAYLKKYTGVEPVVLQALPKYEYLTL